ncbi:unnamed protein product [Amoebophrya sp. A120]|nr:unnamed protein product [Amoebophrya sp. A120]|eukprot:GSA120T00022852001.1
MLPGLRLRPLARVLPLLLVSAPVATAVGAGGPSGGREQKCRPATSTSCKEDRGSGDNLLSSEDVDSHQKINKPSILKATSRGSTCSTRHRQKQHAWSVLAGPASTPCKLLTLLAASSAGVTAAAGEQSGFLRGQLAGEDYGVQGISGAGGSRSGQQHFSDDILPPPPPSLVLPRFSAAPVAPPRQGHHAAASTAIPYSEDMNLFADLPYPGDAQVEDELARGLRSLHLFGRTTPPGTMKQPENFFERNHSNYSPAGGEQQRELEKGAPKILITTPRSFVQNASAAEVPSTTGSGSSTSKGVSTSKFFSPTSSQQQLPEVDRMFLHAARLGGYVPVLPAGGVNPVWVVSDAAASTGGHDAAAVLPPGLIGHDGSRKDHAAILDGSSSKGENYRYENFLSRKTSKTGPDHQAAPEKWFSTSTTRTLTSSIQTTTRAPLVVGPCFQVKQIVRVLSQLKDGTGHVEDSINGILRLLPFGVDRDSLRKLLETATDLDSFLDQVLNRLRTDPKQGEDLVQFLLQFATEWYPNTPLTHLGHSSVVVQYNNEKDIAPVVDLFPGDDEKISKGLVPSDKNHPGEEANSFEGDDDDSGSICLRYQVNLDNKWFGSIAAIATGVTTVWLTGLTAYLCKLHAQQRHLRARLEFEECQRRWHGRNAQMASENARLNTVLAQLETRLAQHHEDAAAALEASSLQNTVVALPYCYSAPAADVVSGGTSANNPEDEHEHGLPAESNTEMNISTTTTSPPATINNPPENNTSEDRSYSGLLLRLREMRDAEHRHRQGGLEDVEEEQQQLRVDDDRYLRRDSFEDLPVLPPEPPLDASRQRLCAPPVNSPERMLSRENSPEQTTVARSGRTGVIPEEDDEFPDVSHTAPPPPREVSYTEKVFHLLRQQEQQRSQHPPRPTTGDNNWPRTSTGSLIWPHSSSASRTSSRGDGGVLNTSDDVLGESSRDSVLNSGEPNRDAKISTTGAGDEHSSSRSTSSTSKQLLTRSREGLHAQVNLIPEEVLMSPSMGAVATGSSSTTAGASSSPSSFLQLPRKRPTVHNIATPREETSFSDEEQAELEDDLQDVRHQINDIPRRDPFEQAEDLANHQLERSDDRMTVDSLATSVDGIVPLVDDEQVLVGENDHETPPRPVTTTTPVVVDHDDDQVLSRESHDPPASNQPVVPVEEKVEVESTVLNMSEEKDSSPGTAKVNHAEKFLHLEASPGESENPSSSAVVVEPELQLAITELPLPEVFLSHDGFRFEREESSSKTPTSDSSGDKVPANVADAVMRIEPGRRLRATAGGSSSSVAAGHAGSTSMAELLEHPSDEAGSSSSTTGVLDHATPTGAAASSTSTSTTGAAFRTRKFQRRTGSDASSPRPMDQNPDKVGLNIFVPGDHRATPMPKG